jgi:hypothetical protein
VKVWWDYENKALTDGLNSTNRITTMDLVARDLEPVTVYFVKAASSGDNYYEAGELPAGYTVLIGLRETADLSAGALLASVSEFTLHGTGTDAYYTADFSLNTAALVAALGTSSTLDCTLEVALVSASGVHKYSAQIPVRILLDVNRGDPAPSQLYSYGAFEVVRDGKRYVQLRTSMGKVVAEFGP